MILSDLTLGMYILLRRGSVFKVYGVATSPLATGRKFLTTKSVNSISGIVNDMKSEFANFKKNLDHKYADRDIMIVFSENPIINLNAPVLWARSLPDERAKQPTDLAYQTFTYFTAGAGGGAGF